MMSHQVPASIPPMLRIITKQLFPLIFLSITQTIVCMEEAALSAPPADKKQPIALDNTLTPELINKQKLFLKLVREGDKQEVITMLDGEDKAHIVYSVLLLSKTQKKGRSPLHEAALGYLKESRPSCFDIFRLLHRLTHFIYCDKYGLNVEELITHKIREDKNLATGLKARAALLIDVIKGEITEQSIVQHILDTPAPAEDTEFLKNVRSGNLQAVRDFLAKRTSSIKDYLNRTKYHNKPALHLAAIGYLFEELESTRSKCLNILLFLLLMGADPSATTAAANHYEFIFSFLKRKITTYGAIDQELAQRAAILQDALKSAIDKIVVHESEITYLLSRIKELENQKPA